MALRDETLRSTLSVTQDPWLFIRPKNINLEYLKHYVEKIAYSMIYILPRRAISQLGKADGPRARLQASDDKAEAVGRRLGFDGLARLGSASARLRLKAEPCASLVSCQAQRPLLFGWHTIPLHRLSHLLRSTRPNAQPIPRVFKRYDSLGQLVVWPYGPI